MPASDVTAGCAPTMHHPATKATRKRRDSERPGWPIDATAIHPSARYAKSGLVNPDRVTHQLIRIVPTVPPTCTAVPTRTAVAVGYPISLTTVGTQLERK